VISDKQIRVRNRQSRTIQSQRTILFGGPDGVGKTKVSTMLSEMTGIPRFKCPGEKSMFVEQSFKDFLAFDLFLPHFVDQTATSFISDRSYVCEWAYSRAYGRPTDQDKLRRIDDLWAERGVHIVILLRRNYDHVEDELIANSMLPIIDSAYQDFCDWTKNSHQIIYTNAYKMPDWERVICDDIIQRSAGVLTVQPTTPEECELLEVLTEFRGREFDGPRDHWILMMQNAYLYLTAGKTNKALDVLFEVDRDLFSQGFWESLAKHR